MNSDSTTLASQTLVPVLPPELVESAISCCTSNCRPARKNTRLSARIHGISRLYFIDSGRPACTWDGMANHVTPAPIAPASNNPRRERRLSQQHPSLSPCSFAPEIAQEAPFPT